MPFHGMPEPFHGGIKCLQGADGSFQGGNQPFQGATESFRGENCSLRFQNEPESCKIGANRGGDFPWTQRVRRRTAKKEVKGSFIWNSTTEASRLTLGDPVPSLSTGICHDKSRRYELLAVPLRLDARNRYFREAGM